LPVIADGGTSVIPDCVKIVKEAAVPRFTIWVLFEPALEQSSSGSKIHYPEDNWYPGEHAEHEILPFVAVAHVLQFVIVLAHSMH